MRFRLLLAALTLAASAHADRGHRAVSGVAVDRVAIDGKPGHWSDLGAPKKPALYTIRFDAQGEAVGIPHCNGRERVLVDDEVVDPGTKGPLVVPLTAGVHAVTIEIKASPYEKRLACSEAPRVGAPVTITDGVSVLRFTSPLEIRARGGGEAVVFVPGGHDPTKPAALLVGTHPWNGTPWTYAAYRELLDEAGQKDLVLLFPNGLGNSLYVADAEEEVLRALDAVTKEIAIDPQRVSIWGASMGGAGATTIAFHHPDRFAYVASYFGDSKYDLNTYVNKLFGGEQNARQVNALDVLENARHLPVFLVHGESDHTSPIRQSVMLFEAMKQIGFDVDFERVPGMAHEGPLVIRYIRRVVDAAARAVAPARPTRVSFRSVRPGDVSAYGVTLERVSRTTDAFADLERKDDGIHVLAAEGVKRIVLATDALGGGKPAILPSSVPVVWSE